MRFCEECGFFKTYVNRRKMQEENTNETIWLHICENVNMPSVVKDSSIANKCTYYDDDTWMK